MRPPSNPIPDNPQVLPQYLASGLMEAGTDVVLSSDILDKIDERSAA